MKVPIIKLELGQEVLQDALEVLKSGMWAEGKNVHALEDEFAAYLDVQHVRAVSNGTAALLCALFSLDIKAGDEVLVPSFTFIASANTILSFGAKPVFVDVDRETFNISVEDLQSKITEKSQAIMPVHLYGLAADMDPIKEIAEKHDLKIIEDACQAHGAMYKGKNCGNLGDVGAFSLYPTKNMICGGEGGLISTNDDKIFEKLKLYSNHGQSQKYVHSSIGFNFRMQDVNGIIARYSLKQLDKNNEKRRENASFYNEKLAGIDQIEIPIEPSGYRHVYHQYTLKVKNRDALANHLRENQVGFGIHYGIPAHAQKSIKALVPEVNLPTTEQLAKEVISLPIHPLLTGIQRHYVVDTIKQFYN